MRPNPTAEDFKQVDEVFDQAVAELRKAGRRDRRSRSSSPI